MADPTSAYAAHIVAQIEANVGFLVEQNLISSTYAQDIIARLPQAHGTGVNSVTARKQNAPVKSPAAPAPVRRASAAPAASRVQKAKAMWAYNEDGSEADDLSFSVGEIVEIVDETNPDWWTGRCRGKTGLFPSNHVEKLTNGTAPAPFTPVAATPSYGAEKRAMPPAPTGPAGSRFMAPGAPRGGPPPPPVPTAQPNGLQEAQPTAQEQARKAQMNRLGGTVANSAAAGAGFAIGGGLVRAIF